MAQYNVRRQGNTSTDTKGVRRAPFDLTTPAGVQPVLTALIVEEDNGANGRVVQLFGKATVFVSTAQFNLLGTPTTVSFITGRGNTLTNFSHTP